MRPTQLIHSPSHRDVLVVLLMLLPGLGTTADAQPPVQVPAPQRASTQSEQASGRMLAKIGSLVEDMNEAEVELKIKMRRSRLMRMKEPIFRAAIADPTIVELVAYGTKELELIGKKTGSTSLTFWMGDENAPKILSVLVKVTKDEALVDEKRQEYGDLQDMINEMYPNSKIQIIPIADKVILRGQARDEKEAVLISQLVSKNAQQNFGRSYGQFAQQTGGAAEPFPDGNQPPVETVINQLIVPGEKQVMLKVRIAQLDRTATRALGANFDFTVKDFFFAGGFATGADAILTGMFNDSDFNLVLRALQANGSAKILAEPTLTTISGVPASFHSGGQFAVPTVVGVDGVGAATTQFQAFGTSLDFTPTVLDKDRIRLQVTPTFSTINSANAVQGIPGLDIQTTSTTVDLREGQVFAIAGLLQDQQASDIQQIPLLGDVPLLGQLFTTRNVSRSETELIVLVTPELVHPMDANEAPSLLPGMEVTEPDDLEFFVFRGIEGRPEIHHRSTVWPTFKSRLQRCGDKCRKSDCYFIQGPYGYSQ